MDSVGFINPGSLADRLFNKGLAQVSKRQARRAIQSPTERSSRGGAAPVFRLQPTSPTGALASVSSQSPDSLFDRKAWPKHYFRLRPASPTGDMPNPCSRLFSDWRDQNRLGPTDREHPLGKDPGTNGESKVGHTSQTTIPGTVPYTPAETVLYDLPDTTEPKQCCRNQHFSLQYCGRH